jgi:hypothetical protein
VAEGADQGSQAYEGPRLPPERAWLLIGYQRIINLARSRLPIMITPDGHTSPQEDWRVIRAAFLARIARTTEALSALVPLGARLDALDLARNLLEHIACLAWIAADPGARFDVWLKKDYSSRLDYDKKLRARIASGTTGRWPEQPLADEDRVAYRKHVRRVQADFPGLPKMFEEADAYWLSRYPAGLANRRAMSFVDQYTYIYDAYSWMAHPRLIGLQAFWDFRPQWTVVHAQEIPDTQHDPLHMGQLLAGQGLLIAAMATGTPDVSDVITMLDSNAGLASLVKQGKLVTVEVSPGHFRLGPAE